MQRARRSIVSLFLHHAISTITEGKNKLCIDEETHLAILRNVDRYGEVQNVKYFGPVNFVIGYSKMISSMPKDAAVLVTLAERIHALDCSLPQMVAQAAALLFFRRGRKPNRGFDGSGGPIVFIRTDGEEWIFSKMVCEDGVPIVEHSQVYKINIFKNDIENDILQQIFDWLRYAITIGRDSMSQFGQTEVNDEETLTAEFSTMLIDINGELSEF